MFEHFDMYVPGAYHHARFMGKSIYLLKMFLLHRVFPLTVPQIRKITRLVGFVVQLYARYFLSAPLSTAAPRHDLTMWYDLKRYRQYERAISDAALSSVRRHLWYLCPELVVLALFDYHTTLEVMAVTLVSTVRPQAFGTGKPGQPAFNPITAKLTEEKPSLAVFITERSWLLFHLLGSDAAWLHAQPAVWSDDEDYENC